MPVYRIGGEASSVSLWDVAGQDAACGDRFIGHVGLSVEERDDLTVTSNVVRLAHMGPPLTSKRSSKRIQITHIDCKGRDSENSMGLRAMVRGQFCWPGTSFTL